MVRIIIAMALLMQQFVRAESVWDQAEFEYRISGFEPDDNFPDGEPPYVPLRHRNALPAGQLNDLPWIAECE